MHEITQVAVLEDWKLELVFQDGQRGVVDLSRLVGKGVFSLWEDREKFRAVRIGPGGGLEWTEQVDLCADSLYLQATGKKPEDIFPSLKRESAHA